MDRTDCGKESRFIPSGGIRLGIALSPDVRYNRKTVERPGRTEGRNGPRGRQDPEEERWNKAMIDLILLAAGPARLDNESLLAPVQGKPLYRYAFEAARQTADAMLGLRVLVVTRPDVLGEAIREFGFNKVIVADKRTLSQAMIAGAKAARSGASRCFLSCAQTGITGEALTAFLQGYILSGRPLGRMRSGGEEDGPMVFAPYLLPHLMALQGEADGSELFRGREGRTFCWDLPGQPAEDREAEEDSQ